MRDYSYLSTQIGSFCEKSIQLLLIFVLNQKELHNYIFFETLLRNRLLLLFTHSGVLKVKRISTKMFKNIVFKDTVV